MKTTIISIIAAGALIIGALIFSSGDFKKTGIENKVDKNNVTVVDGRQIVEIRAKGGFLPRQSVAKADLPTVLRFDTNGTFDCSSVVRIPSMNVRQNLPPSGTTDIDLGSPKAGILYGSCGMGMYPFEIDFRE